MQRCFIWYFNDKTLSILIHCLVLDISQINPDVNISDIQVIFLLTINYSVDNLGSDSVKLSFHMIMLIFIGSITSANLLL